MARSASIAALTLVLAVAGCSGGAREVDYPPDRAIDADIAATRNVGPTGDYPGMLQRSEPLGVFPWNMGERHQTDR